jgi:DNA-binding GntR family transcriptional regulator
MSRTKRKRIPNKILNEIFSQKLSREQSRNNVYTQLKKMVLSGKLKKGELLSYDRIVKELNVGRDIANRVISQLEKDGLMISMTRVGSFVP